MNVDRIAAILVVDTNPRFAYWHTLYYARQTGNEDYATLAMGMVCERLHLLWEYVDEMESFPVISVDLDNLERVHLNDLSGTLLLCGIYGDGCVRETAKRLKKQGWDVAILEDVTLWAELPQGEDTEGIDLVKAMQIFDELEEFISNDDWMWAGGAPHLYEVTAKT